MNNKTQVMGILNVTPDSFSHDGIYKNIEVSIQTAQKMLAEGANIIDIGGESTRPGAEKVDLEEELSRVIPVITALRKNLGNNFLISVDTNKSQVAQAALDNGADCLNSLGGFTFDSKLIDVVAKSNCPIIIYHILGEPKTMQHGSIKYQDVIKDIGTFFTNQINLGLKGNIKRNQFILDPGIGFGKTVDQNLEIIRRLAEFKSLSLPILVGVSRKSHLGLILKDTLNYPEIPPPEQRIEASLAETSIAVQNGATIIRTHDVLATKRFLAILDKFIP